MSTEHQIVPIGKYKGQPVETLLADRDYVEWLLGQSWLRDRQPVLYQTIINYGGEPQDSPEHNQMQALFLDDDFCLRLAKHLLGKDSDMFSADAAAKELNRSEEVKKCRAYLKLVVRQPAIRRRRFEDQGWDVSFEVKPVTWLAQISQLPPCSCVCDHSRCPAGAPCGHSLDGTFACRHSRHFDENGKRTNHCDPSCLWEGYYMADWIMRATKDHQEFSAGWPSIITVECKPMLGDDYPSVLRQVQRYPREGPRACVVVRRFACESVGWDQVASIFATSGIDLVREEDVLHDEPPF